MEEVPVLKIEKTTNGGVSEKGGEETEKEKETEHAEAMEFVERHRDFLEHYARGRIKIEPAPKDVSTFAFDLEKNVIYVNSMFYKKRGFSDEKTLFAVCHEIEHFSEKMAMLSEEGGEKKFEKYLEKIKSSRAFSLVDNCTADIRENRSIVVRTNKGMSELEDIMYREDLFPETDLTSSPRHIQFSEAILREARVPNERCEVHYDVRLALDEVAKVSGLLDVMTDPGTPMSIRLRLQDKYIWPKIEALMEKDIEDKKKSEEENDPNKIFAKDYDKAEKNFPVAVPFEEIEKAFKEWKEKQNVTDPDKVDAEYAEKLGVEKKDLQNYRKMAEKIQRIINPETEVEIMKELEDLFLRIISRRLKLARAPKYPTEDGDELIDPAQLVADVKSGNLEPKVWQDTEIREKRGDKFGEVEVTLICDRSGSMEDGQKAEEQRKSAVMVMEVLKEFAEMCRSEKINMDKPLKVQSEIYSFASSVDDKIPMKKMSEGLGEAERINILKKLYELPGSTTDFNCLEAIDELLTEETKNKMKIGELKKIVIVFTDGGSDNPTRVQASLKALRDSGVVAVGVGITSAGQSVLSTYAPEAMVVENVSRLPVVLGELLKEHLKNL